MPSLSSLKSLLSPTWRARLTRLRHPRFFYFFFPRPRPISHYAGRDRGNPIDRFYIESFLAAHAADIRGHCREIKDDLYTRRFAAKSAVTRADIVEINT